jgi:hypothetical protein
MDTPSFKRRKTASPVRSGYASYQSPTKASLARYNPSLLDSRPRSTQASPIRPKRMDTQRRVTIDPELLKISEHQVIAKSVGSAEHTGDATADDISGPRAVVNDDEDLPETPQKLQNAPEFQDTPPRGILFHSTPRHGHQRESIAANSTSRESPTNVELEATVGAVKTRTRSDTHTKTNSRPDAAPETAADTLELLDMKRRELSKLKDELQSLRRALGSLDKHVDLINKTPETERYADIRGLM